MGNICQGEQAYSQDQADQYFKSVAASNERKQQPHGRPPGQHQQPATAASSINPLSHPHPATSAVTSPTNTAAVISTEVTSTSKELGDDKQATLQSLQHQLQNLIYQTALIHNDNVDISEAARKAILQATDRLYSDIQKLFEAASLLRASNYEHAGQHDRGEKPAILMIEDLMIAQGTLPAVPAFVIEPTV